MNDVVKLRYETLFSKENIEAFSSEQSTGLPYGYCLAVWFPESVARSVYPSVSDVLLCELQEDHDHEADPVKQPQDNITTTWQ